MRFRSFSTGGIADLLRERANDAEMVNRLWANAGKAGYRVINKQTGTTYALAMQDSGSIVECSNASAITVTLPNGIEQGFSSTVVQTGAGQVTFAAESGGSLSNRQSHTKIAGQNGVVRLYVSSNTDGESAAWIVDGDTSA